MPRRWPCASFMCAVAVMTAEAWSSHSEATARGTGAALPRRGAPLPTRSAGPVPPLGALGAQGQLLWQQQQRQRRRRRRPRAATALSSLFDLDTFEALMDGAAAHLSVSGGHTAAAEAAAGAAAGVFLSPDALGAAASAAVESARAALAGVAVPTAVAADSAGATTTTADALSLAGAATAAGFGAAADAAAGAAGVAADAAAGAAAGAAGGLANAVAETDPFDAAGRDLLIFLAATSTVVPLCKAINLSPVLGFLAAGVALGPAGLSLFSDLGVDNKVGEVGILFLLFEQGLELSLKRLKALAKYAFGLGLLQIALCTAAFTLFPFLGGVELLVNLVGSDVGLVDIRRFDESLVVGASLALSSSAFVLKLLQEKGQLTERVGSVSLGVLLMQDIAVVPLLVLLPLIVQEQTAGSSDAVTIASMAQSAGLALGGLGLLGWGGRYVLRFVFEVVASAKSSETFVALCLLVVLGTGALTEALGLSSTLGAFLAGTLLAETNYRSLVEADIQPFRGLLLGLFFMTTGASVDPNLVLANLPTCLSLLVGLIAFKAVIITALGRVFNLSWGECFRTGLLLSGGGEFAFVVLTLAERLQVIPDGLARLLTAIVVLSMALTPALGSLGDTLAEKAEEWGMDDWGQNYVLNEAAEPGQLSGPLLVAGSGGGAGSGSELGEDVEFLAANAVVVCGFGPVGQTVASMMTAPLVAAETETSWLAFDLDPARVREARRRGYPVYYGDASMPGVCAAAGVHSPRAFVVTYKDPADNLAAVERLHDAWGDAVPVLTSTRSQRQLWRLNKAGAADVVPEQTEVSLRLGSVLLESFGLRPDDISDTANLMRATLKERTLSRMQALEDAEDAAEAEKQRQRDGTTAAAHESAAVAATGGGAGEGGGAAAAVTGRIAAAANGAAAPASPKASPAAIQLDLNIVPPVAMALAAAAAQRGSSADGNANGLSGARSKSGGQSSLAPAQRDLVFAMAQASKSAAAIRPQQAWDELPAGTPGVDFCLLEYCESDGESADDGGVFVSVAEPGACQETGGEECLFGTAGESTGGSTGISSSGGGGEEEEEEEEGDLVDGICVGGVCAVEGDD